MVDASIPQYTETTAITTAAALDIDIDEELVPYMDKGAWDIDLDEDPLPLIDGTAAWDIDLDAAGCWSWYLGY